jgi:GAF domain-containing protein
VSLTCTAALPSALTLFSKQVLHLLQITHRGIIVVVWHHTIMAVHMKNFFGKNIIPANDEQRLKALKRYQLIDNIPEGYFTNLANIVARTFDTPIALVSLVDKESVEFPGNHGMEDTKEVSRGLSLCSLAVLDESPTVIPNAIEEPCLLANPLVIGEFGLRFYAGAPITTKDGYNIGTVCVVDKEARSFSKEDEELLKYFAHVAMQEIEARHHTLEAAQVIA